MDKELQRAITLIEVAPSPYFPIINVHLVDVNGFAKFYEIPSLPFQDIEKPKHRGWMDKRRTSLRDGWMDKVKTV